MAVANQDCYYFYYSSCSKGDACLYRHEPAALGSEEVCGYWRQGRCFRNKCHLRHMEIQVDRSSTPCYWESQPSGCTKPHCVFKHSNRDTTLQPQQGGWPPVPPIVPPNRQFVPAAGPPTTHQPAPPVMYNRQQVQQMVINPFDEESDAESLGGGTPVKKPLPEISGTLPPRQKVESMNFGIKSLNDIRREQKRKQGDMEKSTPNPPEKVEPQVVDPPKKIKLSTVKKSPVKDETTVVIKSLEEITREKALESLAKRKAQKLAEAERIQQEAEMTTAADLSDSSRRIIVSSSEREARQKPEAPRALGVNQAPRRTLKIKDRLGKVNRTDREESAAKPTAVKISRIKDRLGPTKVEEKAESALKNPARSTIKSRLGITRNVADSPDSQSQEDDDSATDMDVTQLKVKSLAQIRSEQSSRDEQDMKIKSLAEIRREKQAEEARMERESSEEATSRVLSQKSVVDDENVFSDHEDPEEKTEADIDEVKLSAVIRKENSEKRHKSKDRSKDGEEKTSRRHKRKKLKRSKESTSPKIVSKVTINPASFDNFELKSSKVKRKVTEEPAPSIKRRISEDAESPVKIRRLPVSEPAEGKRRASKVSRVEIYQPPGLKKTESRVKSAVIPEDKPAEEEEKPKRTLSRKTQDWGVKTFSEIMAEKRQKRQQDLGKKSPEKSNTSDQQEPKPKRTFNPIRFGDAEKPAARPKSKITPVTFGDKPKKGISLHKPNSPSVQQELDDLLGESAETVIDPLVNIEGAQSEPESPAKNTKAVTPEESADVPTRSDTMPSEPAPTPTVETFPAPKTPIVPRKLSRQSSETKRRRSSEADSTTDGQKAATPGKVTQQKSLTDDLDFLEEELDDLLGDSVDYRDHAPNTSQTDDALLQEMEELLA